MDQIVARVAQPVAARPIVPQTDRTTRELAVASHLVPAFAVWVMKEYLTEPRRALPWSAGLNTVTVVREAVAAYTRHKIRDKTLIVLLVLLVLTGGAMGANLLTILVGLGLVFLIGAAIFAVLLVDRLVEWWLVTRSFPRFPAHGPNRSWPGEARIRNLGAKRFRAQIDNVARHALAGNVLVFRGERPFVGAGEPVLSETFAIPLVPAEGDEPDQKEYLPHPKDYEKIARFVPTDLYDYICAEFRKLRSGDSLAPSMRLRGLHLSHFVAVAAEEMLDNYNLDPRASWVLPDLKRSPVAMLGHEKLMAAANWPVEWMRYFLQIRIESWDRELVVSLFLHVGCDDRMLYIELTCCILNPISSHFRDLFPARHPWWAALRDLVALPLTIVGRLATAARRIRPAKVSKFFSASTYGTAHSIREMASRKEPRGYFEKADVDRYCEILVRHTVGAIAAFLNDRNISSREFENRVTNFINNSVNNFGNNYGSMAGGSMSNASRPVRDGSRTESRNKPAR